LRSASPPGWKGESDVAFLYSIRSEKEDGSVAGGSREFYNLQNFLENPNLGKESSFLFVSAPKNLIQSMGKRDGEDLKK